MLFKIIVLLAFFSGVSLQAANAITQVSYHETPKEKIVEVHFRNQTIQYDSYIRESPKRLVIECYNTTSLIDEGHTIVTIRPLIGFRLTAKDAATIELILEYEDMPLYTISQDAKKIVVRWTNIPKVKTADAIAANVKHSPGGKQFSLRGIVWRDGKAMALINDDVYSVGARIADYEVKEIKEKTVLLRKGYDTITLYLEE
jgi:hypothetical protein